MSSMTLIDVRDWHRKCATMCRRTNEPALANLHDNMADAIDAHLAGMGEPVGYVRYHATGGNVGIAWSVEKSGVMPVDGDALFTAPPIDIAAVRDVIAEMRNRGLAFDITNKLEAAIKGVA